MAKMIVTRKARKAAGKRRPAPGARSVRGATDENGAAKEFPVVALGASAGGLEAFTAFLKALPPDTGMAFVLIQHLDPTHQSILASLLQRSTKMPIREALDKAHVEPNSIYIIPPNALMTISAGVLSLRARGPRSAKEYPIDQFFESLAEDRRNRAIGVVLSGTARDGTRGLQAIKAEGGITFAQDPHSAQFNGMPASAVASGCVDFTLTPDKIAQELSRMNSHAYIRQAPLEGLAEQPTATDGLRRILRLLRIATGVDFEQYKPAMIGRRVARRMALRRIHRQDQYLELLKNDRPELLALYEDVFIHVTGFFRDPESLEALRRLVLSEFKPGKSLRNIRIWVPGCSTGEEVYSIAMLLFEELGERTRETSIQIFGTDISERSVQSARAGIYSPASMVEVSAERQRRFFNRLDGNSEIVKAIRDTCVFAKHDLSKDPPFSRMDLISCRNVLIYMGPMLQKRVIETFHYALKPGGHLLLGKSESLSAYSALFRTDDAKHKILTCRSQKSAVQVRTSPLEREVEEEKPAALPRSALPVFDIRREAERVLLEKYAPAALIVDANLQIVYFQGNTGPYLAPASGEPSFHLLRVIRPELLVDVRAAIHDVKKHAAAAHKEGVRYQRNGGWGAVDVHVSPITARHTAEMDFLVVFSETAPGSQELPSGRPAGQKGKTELAAKDREIASLREQLHDMAHDHEAANEEVRSMNEEILSSNEELQSTNEELETAKEELESSNEELTTLNDELQKRNLDLAQTSDDLNNVLNGVDIPIVILDADLRIRRCTPAASRVLNLIQTDLGRPLSDIAPTLQPLRWKELISEVERIQPLEREVQDREGRWYSLRVRPYRSGPERVNGFLIALFDIDTVKRSMQAAAEARTRAEDLEARLALANEGSGIGLWEYEIASRQVQGSRQWSALHGFPPDRSWSLEQWLAGVHPEDRKMMREHLEKVITGGEIGNVEYRVVWPDGSAHWLNRRSELVWDANHNPSRVRGVCIDISGQKSAEQERLTFASRLASAQESERRRIARELHDGLIQELAAVAMDLGRCLADIPASSAPLKLDLKAFQGRVAKAAETTRQVAYELHPGEVDDLGFEKALRAYCEQFGRENGVTVEFRSRKVPRKLKREIASCLYKVAREGLRNVAKHAQAKRASLKVDTVDKHIRLRLEDAGKGFQLSSLQGAPGLGVASMRERVQLVNGKFTIQSEPGKGTRLLAEIPMAGSEAEV
jgi:two-component system, chemotaxis family, CheB/CheR fusion protein